MGSKPRMTNDERTAILQLHEEGFSVNEIAKTASRSISSINRVIRSIKKETEKTSEAAEVEESSVRILDIDLNDIREVGSKNEVIKACLIKDRHDYGTEVIPIFDNNFEEIMFKYDKQLETVRTFIKKNFCNNATKELRVYCSGMQSALASVIKVCKEENISLSLMHHNSVDSRYYMQPIFESSTDISKEDMIINDIAPRFKIYCKNNIKEISRNFLYYSISIKEDSTKESLPAKSYNILFDNEDDAWIYFRIITKYAKYSKYRVCCYLATASISNKIEFGDNIAKSFNFAK